MEIETGDRKGLEMAAAETFPGEEFEARVSALGASAGRELPALAEWLEDYGVAALFVRPGAEGSPPVTAVLYTYDGSSRFALRRLSVEEFLADIELDPETAFGDYRAIAASGGEWEMGPWSSPDIPPLTVPVRTLLAEVDALLWPSTAPLAAPDGAQHAERLAGLLAELCATYPTGDGGAVASVEIQHQTGARHRVEVQAGQLEWLASLIKNELETCRNAHADGNGMCAHCAGTGEAGQGR
ncbi:hypothetical protein [Nonomuraea sediminis]|uniref:hypothetical protein n=1 Tax=Nonomuraea sediminis TaxID=2835864 RepID=UPI001BDD104D|nr:hypothetical protein [Nonomuraea sediminis]